MPSNGKKFCANILSMVPDEGQEAIFDSELEAISVIKAFRFR